jgi:enoyl-CoA hydratase/carnithine racemase
MTSVVTEIVDKVGWITLARPEQMNAITDALGQDLESAILHLGADPDVNVLVIRGEGGNFCAGGDFSEVGRLQAEGPLALQGLFVAFRRACDAIAGVDIPVIAAVEGVAMAGGFELMQAADFVLVSDDARISDNHIKFGMIPGGGSTQRLARLVGRQQALGILLSGDRLSGADAVHLGLAYSGFPQGQFEDSVRRFAVTLANRERAAVTTIKRLVTASSETSLAAGLDDEIGAVVRHISTGAGRNGASAFSQRGADK